MQRRKNKTKGLAWCMECTKFWDDRSARSMALMHSRNTGHEVKGKETITFKYKGKKK